MTDIFLSYAREDRERALRLVEALEQQGLPVWWDHDLVPGRNWQRELENAVRQSRCVVVLWTSHSVASDWVREEASLAREQGKLIPVLLEEAEVPMPFRLIQTADLRDWQEQEDHGGFQQLVSAVRSAAGSVTAVPSRRSPKQRPVWVSTAWLLLPTLLVALAVIGLMKWPAPTEVEIDATVSSVQFRGLGRQKLLESTPARWLAVSGFDELRLAPAAAWIADPAKHDFRRDTYAFDAWTPLPRDRTLVLRPVARADAAVTIRPSTADPDNSLAMGQVFAGPVEITLKSPEPGSLSLDLRGQKLDGAVPLPEEFRMDADRCVPQETGISPQNGPMTFKVRLHESARLLEYSSEKSGIRLALGYPPEREDSFLPSGGFAVQQIEFLDQAAAGSQPVSTLAGEGAVRYPGYAAVQPVVLRKGDFLSLEDLSAFRIREIAPVANDRKLRIRLNGIAGKISSGGAPRLRDRRLSWFDKLRQNPVIATLFTVLVWVVPTLIAARTFYRGMRNTRSSG